MAPSRDMPDQTTKEDFPQPRRNDGGRPCGECRLKPGETCDICGAKEPPAQTQSTIKEPVVIVAEALVLVCSDGNSDALRVASDVLVALKRAGYVVVKVTSRKSQ